MKPWRTVVIWAFLSSLFLPRQVAKAEDDWSLTREPARPGRAASPRRPRVTSTPARGEPDLSERYFQALLSRPEDAFALQRLVELSAGRDGSLDALTARVRALRDERPARKGAQELLVRLLVAQGALEEAERELRVGLAQTPKVTALRLLLARVLVSRGQREAARREYEGVLREAGAGEAQATARRALGELALDDGDLVEARRYYVSAPPRGGEGRAERVIFARSLAKHGKSTEAAHEYLALAQQSGEDPRASVPLLEDAARAFLEAGEAMAAVEALERARRGASVSQRAELAELEVEAYRRTERLPELGERLQREQAWLAAARVWDELAEDARALACLEAHLRRQPRDLDARERLARVLARAGRLEELETEYRRLTEQAPTEPRHWVAWAELLRESGRRDQALAALRRASQRASAAPGLHRALADLFTRWNEPRLAAEELQLLARLEPKEPAHVIALGEAVFARGEIRDAIAIWQRLLSARTDRAESHAALARVLGDHDALDDALTHAARALELDAHNLEYLRLQASLLERAGRLSDAERAWQRVLADAGADAVTQHEARQHLAAVWRRQGLGARRMADMEARLRRDSGDTEALLMLAELYAREPNQSHLELRVLEQLIALNPRDVEALRALERAYSRRGRVDDALRALELLVAADPTHAGVYLARAIDLALETYRDSAALAYGQRALSIQPNDAKVQRLVGDLYRRRQDLPRAITAYERAAQLDASDVDSRTALAQLAAARGDTEKALFWWSSVLASSGDEQLVLRAARSAREMELSPLQRDHLERTLLNAALAQPGRPFYRRALLESYAAWFGAALTRARSGGADTAEMRALELSGKRAVKPLVEALSDPDPLQRRTALEMLAALRAKNAGPALLAVAESSGSTSERARALVAVGSLREAASGPRLRALLPRVERRLKPFVLWALAASEGGAASDAVSRALWDPDGGVRTLAILEAGALGLEDARTALEAAADERNPTVSAAAAWALTRIGRSAEHELPRSRSASASASGQVALLAAQNDPRVLGGALFSTDPSVRAAAASLLVSPPRPLSAESFPPPHWPFSAKDYLAFWLSVMLPTGSVDEARLAAFWPGVHGATLDALTGDVSQVAASLRMLVPHAGGLVPSALLARAPCLPPALAGSLGAAVRERLARLARSPDANLSQPALALLASSAGELPPVLVQVLRTPGDVAFLPVLETLNQGQAPSSEVQSLLMRTFDATPSWALRRRIARILGPALGEERLRREPVELVRASARERARPAAARCALPDSVDATN